MRLYYFIGLVLFQLNGLAHDSLSTSFNAQNIPQNLHLSHIEIKEQFIDFKRLKDENYRNQFEFGEALSQSFDSLVPFYHYPATLNLPYYLSDLTFHFAAIEWEKPHRIKYSYYLEGFEKDWHPPKKNAKAIYKNLPYGSYTLKIKAREDTSNWSEPFYYSFAIGKPWWHTWWANLGYSLILVVLGIAIYKFIQQRKKEAAQIEQLLAENRLLAFSNRAKRKVPAQESSFLDQVHQTLEAHLSDENFGIAELCEILKISRTQLHRKLKKLTGQSTSHYIRSLRLDIAKGLLEKTNLNVSEVAFTVGFSSANYFSKVFKEEYGYAPKEAR